LLAVGDSRFATTTSAITLFEAKTGRPLRRLPGHAHVVRAVAFSPDGKHLASAGGDGRLALWDVASSKELWRVDGGDALAFFADGKTLAVNEGCRVRLFEVNPMRRGPLLEGHTDSIMAVAVSPDSKSLASASTDGTVRVWDVATAKERLRLA